MSEQDDMSLTVIAVILGATLLFVLCTGIPERRVVIVSTPAGAKR